MKHVPWNKGLTKHNSEIIARISKKKSAWWKKEDRSETIARIGKASKGRVFPKMEKSKSWKGGRYVDSRDGYVLIYQPEHPNARGDGYVLEHRLVMSKKLGRPIHRNEDINHLNGDKADNRLKNLRLVSHFAHYEEHGCPKCSFKFFTR